MTSVITTSTESAFDYSQIEDTKLADIVRNTAEEIRALDRGIVHNVIAIGKHLQTVKEQLPHGQFGDWLRAEFDLTPSTAYNYMAVAARFGENSNGVGNLPLRTVYALAPSSVPDEAIDEARALAADGITVTPEIARGIRDDVQQPAPEIAEPSDPSDDPDLDADLDLVRTAFATGIPIKSTRMISNLTGIQDMDRLQAALNQLAVTGELKSEGMTTYRRVELAPVAATTPAPVPAAGPASGLDELAIGELGSKAYNWLKEQSEPQGTLAIGSAIGAYSTATKAALEHMVGLGWIEVARLDSIGNRYYRAVTLEDHRQRNPDPWAPSDGDQVPAESAPVVEDEPEAAPKVVQTFVQEMPAESPDSAPGESAPEPAPLAGVALAVLVTKAVEALRNHGEGMFYHELKHFVSADNAQTNQVLAHGVKVGVLVKDSAKNYYTLPEYEARAKTPPAAPAPDSALAQLLTLLEAVKRAQQAAAEVEKFNAQDSWQDIDTARLQEARSVMRRAAGVLASASTHLTVMDRPISAAIAKQEASAAFAGVNGD